MASNNQIVNPSQGISSRSLHTIRLPYFYQAKHSNDEFKNLGYDYRGKVFRKVTSPELWANPMNTSMFGQLESLLTYILEQSKMVKKWMSIAHDKEDIKIN